MLAVVLAGGCTINPPLDLETIAGRPPVELTAVPFHAQLAHHCGPAGLLTVLEHSGVAVSYDEVAARVYVPGLEGSLQVEMTAAARDLGRVAYPLPPDPAALFAEVRAGRPVLVLVNLGVPAAPIWHYGVVVGFDPPGRRVLLRSGDAPRASWKARAWLRRWDWAGRWAMVALRPGEWPAAPDTARLLAALADFEDRAPADEAHRAWKVAVERWPEQSIAWLGLGNTAHAMGDLAAALAAYRRAIAVDPDQLAARLNLAATLAAGGDPCSGAAALGPPPAADHRLAPRFAVRAAELRAACDGSSAAW